jgi:hypothetical protein
MNLSDSYDGSFGGTGFLEIFDGQLGVEPDTGVEYSVTHIPGGSTTIVQSSGQSADTMDLPIAVEAAELSALRTKARSATRATLVWHGGSQQARLMKVKQVRKASVADAYKATLELIMG